MILHCTRPLGTNYIKTARKAAQTMGHDNSRRFTGDATAGVLVGYYHSVRSARLECLLAWNLLTRFP